MDHHELHCTTAEIADNLYKASSENRLFEKY
jgi:hypothetical protein